MSTMFERQMRMNGLVKKIMDLMEKEQFTVGEAEKLPMAIEMELKANSERFRTEKPFTTFK